MVSLIPGKAWIIGAAVVAIVAAVAWLRWDAVRDDAVRDKARTDAARIEHIEDTKERRNDVETLDDDSLLDSLLRRLRPDPTD